MFYGLFGITAPIHNFSISDISQFYSGLQSTDEISWLVVSLWVVAQAVQIGMYCYCLMLCIMFLFDIKHKIPPILAISGFILLIGYISEKTINLESFLFSATISNLTIFTSYVIPIVLWIAHLIKNKIKPKRKQKRISNNAMGGAK